MGNEFDTVDGSHSRWMYIQHR